MKISHCQQKVLFSGLSLLLPLLVNAQLPENVDGENIKRIISVIAADAYQGRETGTRGGEMAEEYFRNEFEKLNLVPVGQNETYYHHYTIPNEEFEVTPSLVIDDRKFYYGYNEDFMDMSGSGRGDAEAEIVFAGYGIYNPQKNRNDYDSIDIRNKIVLIKRGAPRNEMGDWMPSCIDSVKADYCYNHGALGILFFEPSSRYNTQRLMPMVDNHLAEVAVIKGFPIFSIDERVARYIVANSGLMYYRLANILDNQTLSFNTGRKCRMSALPNTKTVLNGRNALGMIPGTDKKLREEYILIGGHIDHIGVDAAGNVRNGADDNASGSAVALGIAQAMVKNRFRPKRSIVFVGWSGEELGLLGSKAWCENPTLDLKKILVYFNLDMVGLGNGNLNMPGTEFAPEVYEFIKKNVDSVTLKRINWSEGGPGGSDHNHFLYKGIPAFAGMTAGSHPDYHQPGDDPEKISADVLQFTGDFIYQCAEKIAIAKENFISEKRFDENVVKLIATNIYKPIDSKNLINDLKGRNFRIAFIEMSGNAASEDPEGNFLALLGAYDNASTEARKSGRYVLTGTAFDAVNTRRALVAAFNPDLIQSNELMIKTLSKFGYRLAHLNGTASVLKDTALLKNLVKSSAANGIGLMLDDMDNPVLDKVLSLAVEPCLIYIKGFSTFSDDMLQKLKSGNHLLVYQPTEQTGVSLDLERFSALLTQVGKSRITITPADLTEEGYAYYKQFLKQFNRIYPDKSFQSTVLTGNLNDFAVKSLQSN